MFLTPGQVRSFERKSRLGAYERESVEDLLSNIATSYDEVWRERDSLRGRVEQLEAELARYKELERVLSDTLVTGQRAAEEVKSEAEKEAEAILDEARMQAARIVEQAQHKREEITGEIGRLRSVERDAQERCRSILVGALEALTDGVPDEARTRASAGA
jgi:cell division initiation protein